MITKKTTEVTITCDVCNEEHINFSVAKNKKCEDVLKVGGWITIGPEHRGPECEKKRCAVKDAKDIKDARDALRAYRMRNSRNSSDRPTREEVGEQLGRRD